MNTVSLPRLYLLRGLYAFIVVGLAFFIWPDLIRHGRPWTVANSVVHCMLAAFSLMCLLGLRYPLAMLPVLLWEMLWKFLWLGIVAFPAWRAGTLGGDMARTAFECIFVLIIPAALPWRYVVAQYVKKAGERWR